jgi:competence protein ComEC
VTPLVALAVAAVCGTLAAAPLSLDGRVLDALAAIALCFRCSRRQESRFVRAAVPLALVCFALNGWIAQSRVPAVRESRGGRFSATALAPTAATADTSTFDARLDDGLTVAVRTRGPSPEPGSRIVIHGNLEPFDDARNPGEPSEAAIERERGLDAEIVNAEITVESEQRRLSFDALLARAHTWALEQLQQRLGEPAASIVAGELWGERGALSPDLHAEFQQTGTVHVLVTAGLHLGVVAALAVAALSLFALPRAWTCGLAVAAVWAFAVWSGAQLPATRAAVMVGVALLARACGRASFSWNALALAAIAIAVARPLSVATPSFALSFSCVGAIFACAPLLERVIEERVALPPAISEALVLSIATQLGTWPLTSAVFLQFSPYAIVANLGVVPCVGLSLVAGGAQLLFSWSSSLAQAIANINGWVVAWMLAVVRTISGLPASSIVVSPAPAHCIALYDGALIFCSWCVRRGRAVAGFAMLFIAVALVLYPPRLSDSRLRITVIDVGQADAILIETPAHHVVLVDAGGRLELGAQTTGSTAEAVGERIVVPLLLRRGIHHLDALLISHPHGDHVGGCAPILRKLRVTEVADSGQTYGGHAYHDCLGTARADGVPVAYPRAGNVWRTDDGVVMHFMGPSLPFISGGNNDINDNSIAFTLRYRNFCMLFTGDAGTNAEQRFLSEHADLRCAILKVGHHGSAYGTTPGFLAAVRPKVAIISVGRHNVFGHPAPSTLATLRKFGSKIYRTDENGAITVVTDGIAFAVTPMLP